MHFPIFTLYKCFQIQWWKYARYILPHHTYHVWSIFHCLPMFCKSNEHLKTYRNSNDWHLHSIVWTFPVHNIFQIEPLAKEGGNFCGNMHCSGKCCIAEVEPRQRVDVGSPIICIQTCSRPPLLNHILDVWYNTNMQGQKPQRSESELQGYNCWSNNAIIGYNINACLFD